jgi:preprotein translocase subunit SecD
MRNRRNVSLVVMLIIAFGALAGTIAAGNKPELGLDLQGGASVVLQPPAGTPKGTINQAIEIIRNRVDALGVAEPQISRQGNAVVVELPGVKNQEKALQVVGTTAELRFRPVLGTLAAEGATTTTSKATTTTSTTVKPGETATPPTTTTSTTSTTAPKTTSREDNKANAQVILPDKDEANGRYALGPAGAVGKAISTARASVTPAGEWIVELEMTGDGIKAFNTVAGECYSKAATCPTGQLAIELDGVVQSAPTIQAASFKRDQIQISGSFKEREAKDLALVLRYGSLPVQLKQQTVRTVSATLGKDSLHAGLVAGIIGTALVLLYMILYYRILGLVVIAGLTIWFSLQWSIISYLGVHNGLALSLSGVTGIVVSVGVTVDSYVVYFERLKDELHAGRTMRSAIDSAFKHSFRTVLVADTSAFMAAAILYFLTVGSVRGFAFFLGLSTILDVVVAYFFKRPLVALLGRWGLLQRSKFVGLRAPVAETVRPGLGGSTS